MPNTLFAVTAPSGSGKTSIMRMVMDNEVISFTTREKREGEKEGIDYLFIDNDKFQELKQSGGLVEQTFYDNHYYGITSEELHKKLNKGNAFVIVDYHGMQQLKAIYPDTVSIFIKTKKEDAIRNMFGRGDSFGRIRSRLTTFDSELMNLINYDYVVSNIYGKKECTVRIIREIIDTYI